MRLNGPRKETSTKRGSGPRIGLALGSGSARGWSHIGVLRGMIDAGLEPDIVCGSSVGALVGGAYGSRNLDRLQTWVESLSRWDVLRLLDVRLSSGGFIQGERLMEFFSEHVEDCDIEALGCRFAATATDLHTGREVWLDSGSMFATVRASIALPGLFSPVKRGDRWLVDGGLVNPVPVSLCRAFGADIVVAVNLNGDLLGKRRAQRRDKSATPEDGEGAERLLDPLVTRIGASLRKTLPEGFFSQEGDEHPGLLDVLLDSVNIMQDRITRSRMAGDPPEVLLTPRLAEFAMMDFHRATEAIREGDTCFRKAEPALRQLIESWQ